MKDRLGHGSNPHGTHSQGVLENVPNKLILFADNDANLYRQSKQPVEANLDRKIKAGKYDHALATKLWGYHADRAAQAYHKQSGNPGLWHQAFSPAARRTAAASWANSFRSDRHL